MNYRHAYHAGNHTEVFKHAALVLLLARMQMKDKPLTVLDTHAGIGVYDLSSAEALATEEAAAGIGAIDFERIDIAAPYLDVIRPFLRDGRYPGSPAIVAAMLRSADRLVACELHRDDARTLKHRFAHDRRVATHHRDGYEAMLALIPPPTKRGIVFVDPPFEKKDEATRAGRSLLSALRKWPTGVYVAWYPVKDGVAGRTMARELVEANVPNCLCAEFLRYALDGQRLAGGGLIVVNPPWGFAETLEAMGRELLAAFGTSEAAFRLEWLTPEH